MFVVQDRCSFHTLGPGSHWESLQYLIFPWEIRYKYGSSIIYYCILYKPPTGTADFVARGRVVTARSSRAQTALPSLWSNLPTYFSWKEIISCRDPLTASVNVIRSLLQFCCPASRDFDDKRSRFCIKYKRINPNTYITRLKIIIIVVNK